MPLLKQGEAYLGFGAWSIYKWFEIKQLSIILMEFFKYNLALYIQVFYFFRLVVAKCQPSDT